MGSHKAQFTVTYFFYTVYINDLNSAWAESIDSSRSVIIQIGIRDVHTL